VFGGYLFEGITSSNGWGVDSRAFIFSLRRLGVTNCLKFMVTDANHAIYGHSGLGPTFGQGIDICIKDNSNINTGSYTNFSCSYESPREFLTKGQHSKAFLAGKPYKWLTTEIEVYQIDKEIKVLLDN
jgi:hypothetical protein